MASALLTKSLSCLHRPRPRPLDPRSTAAVARRAGTAPQHPHRALCLRGTDADERRVVLALKLCHAAEASMTTTAGSSRPRPRPGPRRGRITDSTASSPPSPVFDHREHGAPPRLRPRPRRAQAEPCSASLSGFCHDAAGAVATPPPHLVATGASRDAALATSSFDHGRPRGRHSAAEPPWCPATPSTAAPSFVRVLATVTRSLRRPHPRHHVTAATPSCTRRPRSRPRPRSP